MDAHVLVAYASATGSTRGVAERIAATLTARGVRAVARPVSDQPDPRDYTAVVLGSAVHGRAWLPDAVRYTQDHRAGLADRPLWLFSVGLRGTQRGLAAKVFSGQESGVELPGSVAFIPRGAYHFFAGVSDRSAMGWLGGLVWRALGGKFADYRDWRIIDLWAEGIADSVTGVAPSDRGASTQSDEH
ncbi:flavodoxin domain-containing protein [Actinokineospora sp. HUAS TT18]|uniref:flavodoxin domain-containing protein n=1 Tax=Actinokineospora sp. HUAS TT18 TaxID=3447451 RepID=UPI003F51B17D